MTEKEKELLITGLKKLSSDMAELAAALESREPQKKEGLTRIYTYEEVRGILAEKARTGFRAEVKAILTAHDLKQLSDVKDPETLAAIVAEAEVLGNG